MAEDIICKEDRCTIDLKYDKEKYNIEYVKNKNMIILRRLLDNQVLEIFSDNIGFIVQCNIEGQPNFLVTDYSEVDKNGRPLLKFKHYIASKYSDSLELKDSFDCTHKYLSDCRVTDSSYLVEQDGYITRIYNLKQKSKRFEKVYNDSEIKKIFNNNSILVSEKLHAACRWNINDTLTYGINPETFEITTPIWSELQQRYIDVYTQEQVDELYEKLIKNGLILNRENLDEITIYFEAERYLNEIAKQLDAPQEVYINDGCDRKINKEFVRSFINEGKGRK